MRALTVAELAKVAHVRQMARTPGLLRSIRESAGLTQEDVCRTCGIGGHSTLSKWESGDRVPRSDTSYGFGVVRYAELLDKLIGGQS